MSVRKDTRNIPTTAGAIDRFLVVEHSYKDFRGLDSLLRGPKGRVVGKAAAGTALAKSQLGGIRMDRLELHELANWFGERHKGLSANYRKKNMTYLRKFLEYAEGEGYVADNVRAGLKPEKGNEPQRPWLRPEVTTAVTKLVEEFFDAYRVFVWHVLLRTGVRPEELVKLRADSLDIRGRRLHIGEGKGRGDGKSRHIPVSDGFVQLWLAHIKRYGINRTGWMFFARQVEFEGGGHLETHWVENRSQHITSQAVRRWMEPVSPSDKSRTPGLMDLVDEHLPPELQPRGNVTPRVLRRTFACLALIAYRLQPESGWDLFTLSRALGHASLATTQVYLDEVNEYLGAFDSDFDAFNAAEHAAEALKRRGAA